MRADLARHLSDCRRRGLFVDEDFERGSARIRHAARAAALAVLVAAFIVTIITLARPSLVDDAFGRVLNAPQWRQPDANRLRKPLRRAIVRTPATRAFV